MTAPTLSALQSYRVRLFDALGSGARDITDQNGERVVFRSIAEIQRAIGIVDSMIAQAASGAAPNVIRFKTSKGT